jgi:hypothetical protein
LLDVETISFGSPLNERGRSETDRSYEAFLLYHREVIKEQFPPPAVVCFLSKRVEATVEQMREALSALYVVPSS